MFRPVRLIVLMTLAFLAGVAAERGQQRDACDELGGVWQQAGVCGGVP